MSAGRDGHADASHGLGWQSFALDGIPGGTLVGGFVDRSVLLFLFLRLFRAERVVGTSPQRGVENGGIIGISLDVCDARFHILIQLFLPVLAAIGGLVDSALGSRPMISGGGHQNCVGVSRIHDDAGNDVGLAQADIRPCRAGIG